MTLCQNCRNISFTNLDRSTYHRVYLRTNYPLSSFYVLQPSAKSLLESINNGCPLCAKFWAHLSWEGKRTTEVLTARSDGRWPGEECGEENPRVILSCHYKENESNWLFNGETYVSCGNWGFCCPPSSPFPGTSVEALLTVCLSFKTL